jgi:monoamine oxidase
MAGPARCAAPRAGSERVRSHPGRRASLAARTEAPHPDGMREERALVVGGGFAGLMAARTLARAGVGVDLFEAKERLGGRAWTLHEPGWPLAIEMGAEFVHGRPEPTLALARQAGLALRPLRDRHHWLAAPGTERGSAALVERSGFWQDLEQLLERVKPDEPDMSAAQFMRREQLEGELRASFEVFVRGFEAAPLEDVSLQSLVRELVGGGQEDATQHRLEGGYGALVDWLSRQVARTPHARMHLGAHVRKVRHAPGHVELEVMQGRARRAFSGQTLIVAVPIGLLVRPPEAGGLDFEPKLSDKLHALSLHGVGSVCKVVLCFREPFWNKRAVPRFEFLHDPAAEFPTFWRESRGDHQQITAWRGAPAQAGEAPRGAGSVRQALCEFCRLLGVDPASAEAVLAHGHVHDFDGDPFARGAYSYVRPGGALAHSALAEPLARTLFFAGEATDGDWPATVAGAIQSGERAAHQLLECSRPRQE